MILFTVLRLRVSSHFKTAYSKNTVELMPTMELPLSKRYALWPKAEKQWLRVYNLFAHNLWW